MRAHGARIHTAPIQSEDQPEYFQGRSKHSPPLTIVRPALSAIARSLAGRDSKIWVIGAGAAFLDSPAALRPARWKNYWQAEAIALGLRLSCPQSYGTR